MSGTCSRTSGIQASEPQGASSCSRCMWMKGKMKACRAIICARERLLPQCHALAVFVLVWSQRQVSLVAELASLLLRHLPYYSYTHTAPAQACTCPCPNLHLHPPNPAPAQICTCPNLHPPKPAPAPAPAQTCIRPNLAMAGDGVRLCCNGVQVDAVFPSRPA